MRSSTSVQFEPPRGEVVAITSGKGGVGKTSIAVNLSLALARRRMRVLLLDADIGLANADLLLNVGARYNLSHVASGMRTLEELMIDGPLGLKFIAGASGIEQLAHFSGFARANLAAQIERLRDAFDVLVVDGGAGLSPKILSFAQRADRVLVVTTPEPTALTDGYATIKALHRWGVRDSIGLLVNQVDNRREAQQTYTRVAEVAWKFLGLAIDDAGFCLHDECVEAAVRQRSPFLFRYPRCAASACIEQVADALLRRRGASSEAGGFLRKVAGVFR